MDRCCPYPRRFLFRHSAKFHSNEFTLYAHFQHTRHNPNDNFDYDCSCNAHSDLYSFGEIYKHVLLCSTSFYVDIETKARIHFDTDRFGYAFADNHFHGHCRAYIYSNINNDFDRHYRGYIDSNLYCYRYCDVNINANIYVYKHRHAYINTNSNSHQYTRPN